VCNRADVFVNCTNVECENDCCDSAGCLTTEQPAGAPSDTAGLVTTPRPVTPPPTRRPSGLTVPPVTEQPTDDPTLDQTLLPPTDPAASPEASLQPASDWLASPPTKGPSFGLTERPTPLPTTAGPITERFMNGLPPYSKELASNNASSPQAKALDWLQKDPLYHQYPNVYRLNQRYALAVLYYSTNGDSWDNSTGWLSDDSECTWYQYNGYGPEDDNSCTEASRLAFLDLYLNVLGGTIPTELELLTDLEYMFLLGGSGKIHSEL
jgi:hypothetical protein